MLLLNKYIFQTISFIQVQLPCIVIVLKVIKVIFEFRGQWISPQQSGQWLRRDGRESRICVYIIQAGQEQPLKKAGKAQGTRGGTVKWSSKGKHKGCSTNSTAEKIWQKALPLSHHRRPNMQTRSSHGATERDDMIWNLKQRHVSSIVLIVQVIS